MFQTYFKGVMTDSGLNRITGLQVLPEGGFKFIVDSGESLYVNSHGFTWNIGERIIHFDKKNSDLNPDFTRIDFFLNGKHCKKDIKYKIEICLSKEGKFCLSLDDWRTQFFSYEIDDDLEELKWILRSFVVETEESIQKLIQLCHFIDFRIDCSLPRLFKSYENYKSIGMIISILILEENDLYDNKNFKTFIRNCYNLDEYFKYLCNNFWNSIKPFEYLFNSFDLSSKYSGETFIEKWLSVPKYDGWHEVLKTLVLQFQDIDCTNKILNAAMFEIAVENKIPLELKVEQMITYAWYAEKEKEFIDHLAAYVGLNKAQSIRDISLQIASLYMKKKGHTDPSYGIDFFSEERPYNLQQILEMSVFLKYN